MTVSQDRDHPTKPLLATFADTPRVIIARALRQMNAAYDAGDFEVTRTFRDALRRRLRR